MRKLLSVVLAGAMALSMTACSSKPAETTAAPAETSEAAAEAVTEAVSSEAKEGGYTIGFSPYTLTNEYFTAVLNGVQTACDELGCELIYFDPQNDPTKQASQIDDMIASGINALVYIPYDSAGAQTVLQTCKDAGVKVINVDNVIQEEDYDLVDGIIASDNT
ncbi:substrate-binding domain-containing protein, partial [[Clostridium] symbiosum]